MVVRVSPDDIVLYANGALCAYLGASKVEIIGSPLAAVAQRCEGEISSCFYRPKAGRAHNHLVTDSDGRVFEAKIYSDGGMLDVVLDEVTSADVIGRELRSSTGTPFHSLTEDELRTTRQPERRYLTVSHTLLRDLSDVSDRLAPMEARLMVNSFIEEVGDAVWDVGCTVGETTGDGMLGLFGAPRYFADHPLRAVRAACDQLQRAAQLHSSFLREGKELPPCSCGLWTGDTLVGTLGNSVWLHYTALGKPVDLARKLATLARPGEILLPEHTLTHLLRVLPEGWQHIRAESEYEPDLSDFQWPGNEIETLPEHLKKVVYLVGPNLHENTDRIEYYFDYLWAFRVPGRDQLVPILRVVRPTQVGDSLELSEDNVVTTQAVQTLGKYKLLEVIGIGGMGRVWRGVDRFGNAVAIKVLHASEAVSEGQIKRFRREADVMARLPHRNICRVYEMSEYEGVWYIAMEFVNGLPLSDLLYEKTVGESEGRTEKADLPALISSIRAARTLREQQTTIEEEGEKAPEADSVPRAKRTRILPVEQTLNIVLKVCDAVQYAHEHGVLHRDLKPGNILLREEGEPLVADFGLAKINTADATQSLSVTGHVVGTLENMAPEQAESSKDVDERADVFSLGTILYQMLTGRRHFEATGNIIADAQALKTHTPLRLRALNPHIDVDLEIITLKALRIDPVERYRNVAALKADIEHYRRGEVIAAKPVTAIDLAKKLIQRNKAVTLVTASSFLIFICGTLLSIGILMKQLAREQSATQYAKEQRSIAEQQRARAEDRQRVAEEQEARATEVARQLKEQELMTKSASQAAQNAKQMGEQAVAQTESEKKRREEAEKTAKASEKQAEEYGRRLEEMRSAAQETAIKSIPVVPPRDAGEDIRISRDAMAEAVRTTSWGLAPLEVQRLGKNIDEVMKRVMSAIDQTSRALVYDDSFVPAWMLKGRLHLALSEYDSAAECFKKAADLPSVSGPGTTEDDPGRMALIATELSRSLGDRSTKTLDLMKATDLPGNEMVSTLVSTLSDRNARHLSSVTGRSLAPNELALALMTKNPGVNKPEISTDAGGRMAVALQVTDVATSPPIDISMLKGVDLGSLSIHFGKLLDWNALLQLPLDNLDLTGCAVDSLPALPQRSLLKIRTLNLNDTSVGNIDGIRQMPLLESLFISGTKVTDLAPLAYSRRLRLLDIASLNPANLRLLNNLPLETLVISPEDITDVSALQALRLHRTLRFLRSPNDPEGQTAIEFWRKFDSGAYQKTSP
jgi:serine/threonine protein kinase/class 3 adenylate cyclase